MWGQGAWRTENAVAHRRPDAHLPVHPLQHRVPGCRLLRRQAGVVGPHTQGVRLKEPEQLADGGPPGLGDAVNGGAAQAL